VAVQVHKTNEGISFEFNSLLGGDFLQRVVDVRPMIRGDVVRRFRATPASAARSASSTAATAAAWAPRETPPEEIPPCRVANSSARGFLPADAPLLLPAAERNSLLEFFNHNLDAHHGRMTGKLR
jgi:hypothetical protein